MGEPKPLASLSSSLLARKGHAKPAMRPQGFASFGYAGSHQPHDDLGWNDMGLEAQLQPHPAAPAASASAEIVPIAPAAVSVPSEAEAAADVPAVLRQQEELQREWTVPPQFAERAKRAAPGAKGKAAFTLRLDPDRHLRLRLACAVAHKSAQALVVAALDAFLETQPAVSELARAASAKPN